MFLSAGMKWWTLYSLCAQWANIFSILPFWPFIALRMDRTYMFSQRPTMVGNHFDVWVIGALMTSFLSFLLPAWDVAGRVQTWEQWNHLTPNYGKLKGLQTWGIWTIYFQVMGIQFCVRESASLPEVSVRERWISQLLRIQVLHVGFLGKAEAEHVVDSELNLQRATYFIPFPPKLWLQKMATLCQIVIEDVDETVLSREARKEKKNKKPESPPKQVGQ